MKRLEVVSTGAGESLTQMWKRGTRPKMTEILNDTEFMRTAGERWTNSPGKNSVPRWRAVSRSEISVGNGWFCWSRQRVRLVLL